MREPKTMGLQGIVEKQKAFFDTDATKSVEFRVRMLRRLENAIRRQENEILLALHQDLSKSGAEAYMTELAMVYGEIREAIRHVRQWSRPKRVGGTLSTFPAKNYIYAEPYGVVLILAPWNYPFNLTMAPLTAAIAAGNCAVVKCSKESSRTAQVMGRILRSAFGENYVYCADAKISHDEVLHQSYDYIFFTGSPRVGRIVMRTASERLTPVSLELGGKSPCIIDETANIALAAKRVAWGKLLNAGQTCISVDYVLVHERVKQAFLKALQREIARRYPDAANDPNYPKIINRHHYERLSALMKTEKTMLGGQQNEAEQKIAPAIFPDADFDHEIMQEEIFGPLLPVIGYRDLAQAMGEIKAREKPLALYLFTQNKKNAQSILHSLSFGGGCVNDVVLHITNHHLPFGGVGHSGMGAYHGKFGFETFSHQKGIVKNTTLLDVPVRYAPFGETKLKLLRKIL